MIANPLRARGNRRLIEALHAAVVAAARRSALFLPPYEVADTLEARFDLLVLFSVLLARRLESLPRPGPEVAQELVDVVFAHFDADLREMGVGDLGVPKRMKKLAEAFSGRSAAYRGALAKEEPAFAAAIARNIYGREGADARASALAAYCRELILELEQAELAQILADPPFPDPERRSMSAAVDANRRSPFSRPLRVEDVPIEGLDLTISATEAERQALAAEDGLAGLAKLEGALHVVPWRGGGLAVTGEMRARITQTCVVTLDPFDSEIVEPIDVKFAPLTASMAPATGPSSGKASRARRRVSNATEAPPAVIELDGDDPPDPIIDGQIDLGAVVAEFLALALDPYPRKPGVAFEKASPPEDPAESPFARLEALKGNLPRRG